MPSLDGGIITQSPPPRDSTLSPWVSTVSPLSTATQAQRSRDLRAYTPFCSMAEPDAATNTPEALARGSG